MTNRKVLFPIAASLILAAGVAIGSIITQNAIPNTSSSFNNGGIDKLSTTLQIINANYVDSIDVNEIAEDMMPTLLKKLDPHSSYIPAKDLIAINEDLDGSFAGIGIQFNIQEDTIYIVDVISASPSEKAGIMPGDRIIEVDDSLYVGKNINNEIVFNTLRGKKGSKVKLSIVRRNTKELLKFEITRDDIPVHSVDISYIVADNTGLIAINKFGAQTYNEFLTGVAQLAQQGAKNLIVDLRGNAGGYLDAAINMTNEFLVAGDLIVYVEGDKQPRQESYANGTGSFQNMPLVVMIDEFSGSASEIFAGAIQDNDRGTIIGRRSFGKGLVQRPFDLQDGSQVRLTIARYYTPSGRCIQKPYDMGKGEEYEADIIKRYNHGEFFNADSISQADSLIYKTKNGRIVYGGGGIMPDIFVPRDTNMFSPLYFKLLNKSIPYKFALEYSDKNRSKLKAMKSWENLYEYLKTQDLFSKMRNHKLSKSITFSTKDLSSSEKTIEKLIQAYIVRNIFGDEGFYPIWNEGDKTIEAAIKSFDE